jgi:tetratricopeptide (TPR) repeat protein
MKHLLVIALVALPLVALARPNDKDRAQKHIAKATEAHQAGNYDVALAELQEAYALDPQPDLLYAIGQVYVKLGKCPEAVASYEKFLATNPPPEPTAATNEAIAACKSQMAPPPPPEPTPAPQAPPPPVTRPEGRPFYTDVVGDALVGAGIASVMVSALLYSSALGTLDDAEAAMTYSEHQDLVDSAHTKRNIGVAVGAVGLAAISVGVWHYTKYRSEQSVAVTPTASGGMVSWMGRF